MSLLSHIDDVSYTTALQNDKLLGDPLIGSFLVGAGLTASQTVNQPFGEKILPVLQFSIDNSTWNDAGAVIYDSSGGTLYQATCYTNQTSLVIVARNSTGSPVIFYYRAVLISEL